MPSEQVRSDSHIGRLAAGEGLEGKSGGGCAAGVKMALVEERLCVLSGGDKTGARVVSG